jgi:transcriptional regulator with XRE-family HTH domain
MKFPNLPIDVPALYPTSNEIYWHAYFQWRFGYQYNDVDHNVRPFLSHEMPAFSGSSCWLKSSRLALQLSIDEVAQKLKLTRAGYSKLETSELAGTLTLEKMRAAAEAMNCELILAVRAKNRRSFSENIWRKLIPTAATHPYVIERKGIRKIRSIVSVCNLLLFNSDFRKSQGWSKLKKKRELFSHDDVFNSDWYSSALERSKLPLADESFNSFPAKEGL